MKGNRLFTILRTLERNEFLEFGRYIIKGFLKKGPKAIVLFKHVRKYYPQFDDDNLHRAVIYKKLFQKQMCLDEQANPKKYKQDNKRILDVVGDLSNLAEEYIILLHIRKKDVDYQMLRINALKNKGLDDLHEKAATALGEELQKKQERGRYYHLNQYILFDQKYFQTGTLEDLFQTMHHLDRLYLMAKLGLMNELLQREVVLGESKKTVLFRNDVLKVAKTLESKAPSIAIYFLVQHLYTDNYEIIFHKLRKLAYKYRHLGNPIERFIFLTILINACAIYTQRGNLKYNEYAYGLYHFGLRHKILILNGNLHELHFQNIIDVTVVKKGIDYTRFIIRKYIGYLGGEQKEGAILIYEGDLFFRNKKYQEVVNLLRNQTFRYFPYELRSRSMVLRSCYELEISGKGNNFADFDKVCDAFEKYLKRHEEISSEKRTAFKNFIVILKGMRNFPYDRKLSIDQLKIMLEESKPIAVYYWLKERLEALKR